MRLHLGYVKYFDNAEGIGLIITERDGKEIYVNRRSIATEDKSLAAGQQVEFVVYQGHHGLTASDVIGL